KNMVQEFHVLRCYSCQTYQVQQVKKSKKWNCKMCGEKQSVLKEFGRGSGVDCRRHVQKLNARQSYEKYTDNLFHYLCSVIKPNALLCLGCFGKWPEEGRRNSLWRHF
uniref:MRN complex-interacting protein N-terminal domain-containing protein n=1 Tax=Esox lucius TaxID=8010 RepID=A0A3P9AIJ9_ESOLU